MKRSDQKQGRRGFYLRCVRKGLVRQSFLKSLGLRDVSSLFGSWGRQGNDNRTDSAPWHSAPTAFLPLLPGKGWLDRRYCRVKAGSTADPTHMDRCEVERMTNAIHWIMHWAVSAWQILPYPPQLQPQLLFG